MIMSMSILFSWLNQINRFCKKLMFHKMYGTPVYYKLHNFSIFNIEKLFKFIFFKCIMYTDWQTKFQCIPTYYYYFSILRAGTVQQYTFYLVQSNTWKSNREHHTPKHTFLSTRPRPTRKCYKYELNL